MTFKPLDRSLPKLWDDLALRPYLGEIRRRHGIVETLALPSMRDLPPLRIETTFVSPLLSEEQVYPDIDPSHWPKGQNLLNALETFRQLVVLGDPGGGKTTLSNWLAWRLSSGLTSPLPPVLEDRVPLPCILREMPPTAFTPGLALPDLAVWMADALLGGKADDNLKDSLRARVCSGHYVLILDGVDEISRARRKIVAEWIKQARLQNTCVLATSRIVGYEDYPVDRSIPEPGDGPETQSYSKSPEGLPAWLVAKTDTPGLEKWAEILYLMPFDQHRINIFAENWYRQRCGTEQEAKQKTEDLLASLTKSEATRQLARTPNLLSLMAIVHRERAHLPDGKALLYDEIANAYINTIDQQRKILPGDVLAPYGWKERKTWLAYIGFRMQQLRLHSKEDDDGLLAQKAEVTEWLAEAMENSGVKDSISAAEEFLAWVARRSCLLLPRGEDRYAFVHLSFQEYFCACYLDTRIVKPNFFSEYPTNLDPINSNEVNTENLRTWSRFSIWRETFVYLFELLSAERGSDWVDALANLLFSQGSDESRNFEKNLGMLTGHILANQHIRSNAPWKVQLKYVDFRGTSAPDLMPLAGLDNLRELNLNSTSASDLTPLAGLENLEMLVLEKTSVTDLTPLAGLKSLKRLNLNSTSASVLTPLEDLKKLETLFLKNTSVTDLTPLAGLKNLNTLTLKNTSVTDLMPLAGLENLKWLGLENTSISDVRPLARLENLRWLYLENTSVSDVSPLAGLKKLEMLVLENTSVSDVTPLAGLKSLKILNINNTLVTDLTPLAGLRNLSIQHESL